MRLINKISLIVIFFIFLIFLFSFSSVSSFNYVNDNQWSENRINSVIDSIYTSNWDFIDDGFFTEVNEDKSVHSSIKQIGDYYTLTDLYLSISDVFENTSYISLAESMIPFIMNFKQEPGGYVSTLSQDWTLTSDSSYHYSTLAQLINSFLSLHDYTGNQTYLNEALDVFSFIDTFSLDDSFDLGT